MTKIGEVETMMRLAAFGVLTLLLGCFPMTGPPHQTDMFRTKLRKLSPGCRAYRPPLTNPDASSARPSVGV